MKGAIYRTNSRARIVDLTHSVPPQHIAVGAKRWRDAALHFPSRTLHLAVVDPGVGTARRFLLLEAAGSSFFAPDNGLITYLVEHFIETGAPCSVHQIQVEKTPDFDSASHTFHGRDLFGPIVARFAQGQGSQWVGEAVDDWVRLPSPSARLVSSTTLIGVIVDIDAFGNAITSIRRNNLGKMPARAALIVFAGGTAFQGVETYANASPGTQVALWGSSQELELAVVNGSAAALGLSLGDEVRLELLHRK